MRFRRDEACSTIRCGKSFDLRNRSGVLELRLKSELWPGNLMIGSKEVLEALPVAVYLTDTEGRLTFYNEAAAEFWGFRPELYSSLWCGSWRLYWPDGRPMAHDECPMAVALREGRELRGVEALAERPDGSRVPFIPYPTLL